MPLLPQGAAMLDVASRPLGASWGPIQLFLLQITRGGGWSALAFLSGFDDTRSMRPYGLTYREPLFLLLWLILDFNWTLWYLPAFVIMRSAFCAAHYFGFEKTHIVLLSQIWLEVPLKCPSGCFCPWQDLPGSQTWAQYSVGWW